MRFIGGAASRLFKRSVLGRLLMRTLLLLLVTISAVSFVPLVASAATLIVSGGRLMGATDVEVGGEPLRCGLRQPHRTVLRRFVYRL